MIRIFTIGVYNSTEEEFFSKLINNKIQFFCDIRQRRGVRGSLYKFVNSNYLQIKLHELGIQYRYIKELAPTNEIREKQKIADKLNHETKKQRTHLGFIFEREYKKQIMDKFNFDNFLKEFSLVEDTNIVFFCVEEHASACHRSLVAQKACEILNINPINL